MVDADSPLHVGLLGETCQQFADEFTTRHNGMQWTQPLLHFIVFEMAVDTFQRATDVDDKETILAAIKTTKLETIGGPDRLHGAGGTRRSSVEGRPAALVENVYKTPQVGGQWRKGTKYPYELTVCSNARCLLTGIAQDKVQPLA